MANTERFNRLYAVPGPVYQQGSPVLIQAGALLHDRQSGRCLAQLKFASVSAERVSGIKVMIESMDMEGLSLGSIGADYPDINLTPGEFAGDRIPVYLPNGNARMIRVRVTTVVFANGGIWKNETMEPFARLPEAKPLALHGLLAEEYQAELSEEGRPGAGKCELQHAMGLWQCGCEAWNAETERRCLKCGMKREWLLEHRGEEGLKQRQQERAARETEEARRLEEQRIAAEEEEARLAEENRVQQEAEAALRKRRNKKILMIAAAVAVVVAVIFIVLKVIIPNQRRDEANQLILQGRYAEAQALYATIDDGYREFKAQVRGYAEELEAAKDFDNAIAAYEFVLMDAAAVEVRAAKAAVQCAEKQYAEAYQALEDVTYSYDEYNMQVQDIRNEVLLAWADALKADGDYDAALEKLELCVATGENSVTLGIAVGTARTEIYRAKAEALMQAGAFEAAGELYFALEDEPMTDYAMGRHYEQNGEYASAYVRYFSAEDIADAKERAARMQKLTLVKPQVGDLVCFGTASDGGSILWKVLEIKDDRMLLLSEWCLEERSLMSQYNKKFDWENSSARAYLNSDLFYRIFSKEERSLVQRTSLQNDNNVTTQDNLFILSKAEVLRYLPTAESRDNGEYWWLRTSAGSDDAYNIDIFGDIDETFANYDRYGLRPAITVLYLESEEETYAEASDRIMGGVYAEALTLKEQGEYDKAIAAFDKIPTYKDSEAQISACYELKGDEALNSGDFAAALEAYTASGNTAKVQYVSAMELLLDGEYAEAANAFRLAGDVFDAPEKMFGAQLKSLENAEVGDVVYIGSYGAAEAGRESPLIPWMVFEAQDGEATLLATETVLVLPFNEEWTEVSWADATLRGVLNGDMLNALFNERERLLLLETQVDGAADTLYLPGNEFVVYSEDSSEIIAFEEAIFRWSECIMESEDGGDTPVLTRIPGETADMVKVLSPIMLYYGDMPLVDNYVNTPGYVYPMMRVITDYEAREAEKQRLADEYAAAEALFDSGDYAAAAAVFEALGDYADSAEKMQQAQELRLAADYAAAEAMITDNPLGAYEAFISLADYEDSEARAAALYEEAEAVRYASALEMLASGEYDAAIEIFEALGDYEDSAQKVTEAKSSVQKAQYDTACELLESDDAEAAIAAFEALGYYLDSPQKLKAAQDKLNAQKYDEAYMLYICEEYEAAAAMFESLGDYSDSAAVANELREATKYDAYRDAEKLLQAGDKAGAAKAFLALGDYMDSAIRCKELTEELEANENPDDEETRQLLMAAGMLEPEEPQQKTLEEIYAIIAERSGWNYSEMIDFVPAFAYKLDDTVRYWFVEDPDDVPAAELTFALLAESGHVNNFALSEMKEIYFALASEDVITILIGLDDGILGYNYLPELDKLTCQWIEGLIMTEDTAPELFAEMDALAWKKVSHSAVDIYLYASGTTMEDLNPERIVRYWIGQE